MPEKAIKVHPNYARWITNELKRYVNEPCRHANPTFQNFIVIKSIKRRNFVEQIFLGFLYQTIPPEMF